MLKNRLIYLTVSTCTPLIIMRTLQRKLIVKINSMKGKNLSIMAMIAAVFCSCGQQPAQERGPRPVKLAEVTSLSRIEKSYSGVVSPDQFSDLAFKMSGPLVAMNVLEGQRVKKGHPRGKSNFAADGGNTIGHVDESQPITNRRKAKCKRQLSARRSA